jgi:hypothetical protein
MFPTIAISFEGDDADRASLRELARRRKTTVGKLTKEAVWAAFGDELREIKPFFVETGVSREKRKVAAGK